MLPKGEWPKWCRTCGGSGLSNCSRCLGTGEYRYIMGFHFMKMDTNHTQDDENYRVHDDSGTCSAVDIHLKDEQFNSSHER
ncbi:unnamed protein product [Ilex paraguariensis]|uniref:Uncharacterized protein n=3 Tax=Ilex paraguariensis TaxID=185542 RepID=A0ABC8U388_9AQUA